MSEPQWAESDDAALRDYLMQCDPVMAMTEIDSHEGQLVDLLIEARNAQAEALQSAHDWRQTANAESIRYGDAQTLADRRLTKIRWLGAACVALSAVVLWGWLR